MKIYVNKASEQKVGGGFSWIDNFKKGMGDLITDYNESDIFLIPSPTLATHDEVDQAKSDGKKIVLRLDNVVKDSRNRGTGMSRMKAFSEKADLIIYQSQWAKGLLMPFLQKEGKVILNGTDLDVFNNKGRKYKDKSEGTIFGYARYNRDESKNWNVAAHEYIKIQQKDPQAQLWIIGNFSPELVEYGFDFYMGENYKFWGVQPREAMADLYRQIDVLIYSYWNDACSNVLIEALVSGCEVIGGYYLRTGGAEEVLKRFAEHGTDGLGLELMCEQYKSEMEKL